MRIEWLAVAGVAAFFLFRTRNEAESASAVLTGFASSPRSGGSGSFFSDVLGSVSQADSAAEGPADASNPSLAPIVLPKLEAPSLPPAPKPSPAPVFRPAPTPAPVFSPKPQPTFVPRVTSNQLKAERTIREINAGEKRFSALDEEDF